MGGHLASAELLDLLKTGDQQFVGPAHFYCLALGALLARHLPLGAINIYMPAAAAADDDDVDNMIILS